MEKQGNFIFDTLRTFCNSVIIVRHMRLLILFLLPCLVCADPYSLQTPEDSKRLGFFSALLNMAEKRERPAGEIPKVLHFIWLGPAPFPESSVANVRGWIDQHPGWKVRFWTDLGQSAPDDRMQVSVFDKFPLQELKELYYRSDNFGERSQILRFAVLLSVGGVYVDHDVTCIQPLDKLLEANDFFCGMESLGPTVLSSSVNPSPHLIASTAQHPILKSAKSWLLEQWDRLDLHFPGSDPDHVYNRTQHRTFRALSVGIKAACARAGRKDSVFPPEYFSLSSPERAVFATHAHAGTWYKGEDVGERKTHRLLNEVEEEFARTYWISLSLAAVNVVLGAFLLVSLLRRKEI